MTAVFLSELAVPSTAVMPREGSFALASSARISKWARPSYAASSHLWAFSFSHWSANCNVQFDGLSDAGYISLASR